jgi:hypothetical protein
MSAVARRKGDVTVSLDEKSLEILHDDKSREIISNLEDDSFISLLWEEGNFELEINVRQKEKLELDGNYVFAPGVPFDLGKVSISVTIPPTIHQELDVLSRKLRGILAHEFQHVVQRVFLGKNISRRSNLFKHHLTDPFEIEARIEEVIASMEKHVIDDEKIFEDEISKLIFDYISRNGSNLSSRSQKSLLKRSVKSHVETFRNRKKEEI